MFALGKITIRALRRGCERLMKKGSIQSFAKNAVNRFQSLSVSLRLAILFCLCCTAILFINDLYFTRFTTHKMEENIINGCLISVEQAASNLNNNFRTVIKHATVIRDTVNANYKSGRFVVEDERRHAMNYLTYQELYADLLADNENYWFVHSLLILNANGSTYSYTRDGNNRMDEGITFDIVSKQLNPESTYQWLKLENDGHGYTSEGRNLISFAAVIRRYGNLYSIILVNFDEDYIRHSLTSLNLMGEAFLYDEANKRYIAPEGFDQALLEDGNIQKLIHQTIKGGTSIGSEYMIASAWMQVNGWDLMTLTSRREISKSFNSLPDSLLLIVICSLLGAFLISLFIARTVSRPLKKLTRIMSEVGDNDKLTVRFLPRYRDEVGILVDSFNCMMDRIIELTEKIRYEQTQKKIADMKLLQMQIKPHFLYNALETTRFLIALKDERAIDMVSALSGFYKLSLGNMQEFISVGEEVDQLKAYLEIMSIRYTSKFSYHIHMDDGLRDYEICKFILQPLVENAIYHGIKQVRRHGEVRITLSESEKSFTFEVFDNGAGVGKEQLAELRDNLLNDQMLEVGKNIGLSNVQHRIRLYYGEEYRLRLESVLGEYFCVCAEIPKRLHIERDENNASIAGS